MPPFNRGDVYYIDVTVTQAISWATVLKDKYVIMLQDPSRMHPRASNFAFVLASTDNEPDVPQENAERYLVKLDEGDGFSRPTVVDGRWVYTLPRPELQNAHYQL
jgi:hypothetical protein